MKTFLLICILSTLSCAVKVDDDKSKVVSTSSIPEYEKVDHEVIEVPLPSEETLGNDVLGKTTESLERSNVKARKGVQFEQLNTTATQQQEQPKQITNDKSYKVQEHVDDVVNKHPPVLNENSTIMGTKIMYGPSPSVDNNNNQSNNQKVVKPQEDTTVEKSKPKKPTITYSEDDDPSILKYASKPHRIILPEPKETHSVEEPEQAMSKELIAEDEPSFNGYFGYIIISCIVLVFIAIPVIFGGKLKDYWKTRHYRRVDFLVDGMYND
jgi:hypothetical protein